MKILPAWASEYRTALREYLAGTGESALHRAYELGRRAIEEKLSILDVASVHNEILSELLTEAPGSGYSWQMDRVTEFFVESLSPFEMTHRGFQEANAKLLRWKHVFERAGWGIVISSPTGDRMEAMNPAFARMHGYEPGELIGRSLLDLFDPGDRAELAERFSRTREEGHASFEATHLRRDGGRFPVLLDATAVRGEEGELLYLAINVQDITERKRYEMQIEAARAAAEALSRELEAFSYSVAHDLRAPLRTINGFSEMLLEDHAAELSPDGARKLRAVADGAKRMARLIDDLLEFSRTGRADLRPARVDMAGLAREVADELLAACPERKIDLTVADLGEAWGDRALLRQVFVNLLGNAIKFTARRDVARIEVGSSAGADATTYWVKDDGAGFDMAYAPKLFGVFQRLHSTREFEGTGVGLALVQRVIHRHGGRIWAEGAVDRGATFSFTLPR